MSIVLYFIINLWKQVENRTCFQFLKWKFFLTHVLSFVLSQVYYLPFTVFYNQCVLPTLFTTLPLMRDICIRENISILHGHSVRIRTGMNITLIMLRIWGEGGVKNMRVVLMARMCMYATYWAVASSEKVGGWVGAEWQRLSGQTLALPVIFTSHSKFESVAK